MIVTPLFDRVLVLPMDDIGIVKGNMVIPDIARNSGAWGYGEVKGVGPGRNDAQGVLVKVKLKPGDVVMFPRKAGMVIPIPTDEGVDVDHLLFREPEILAKVTDLPKQSLVLDAEGKRLMAMTPNSHARQDSEYRTMEETQIAVREGWLDPGEAVDDAVPFEPGGGS